MSTIEQPSFNDVEAAGLDGTLRDNDGFYTWPDVAQAHIDKAAEHLSKALDALMQDELFQDTGWFRTYPQSLPSFDELVFAIKGVEVL